ncbi:uncharacterized protein CLUP02_12368 [Colletotrichum lupini]|uniref:Uncharacterized protein n=1 Tax=Colletotrichum lupini TaxID=145971 RepID=A0A9Q8T0C5_9PEZI|nr:uncharacterized protein CLUP02_12368 [Colletotrichum lupini]UQC86866.1 hypothetical protein CLUP02_12368 [Colletotrichum lupini]
MHIYERSSIWSDDIRDHNEELVRRLAEFSLIDMVLLHCAVDPSEHGFRYSIHGSVASELRPHCLWAFRHRPSRSRHREIGDIWRQLENGSHIAPDMAIAKICILRPQEVLLTTLAACYNDPIRLIPLEFTPVSILVTSHFLQFDNVLWHAAEHQSAENNDSTSINPISAVETWPGAVQHPSVYGVRYAGMQFFSLSKPNEPVIPVPLFHGACGRMGAGKSDVEFLAMEIHRWIWEAEA